MTPDPCPHCAAGRAVQLRLAERIYVCYEIFCRLAVKGRKATVTTDDDLRAAAERLRTLFSGEKPGERGEDAAQKRVRDYITLARAYLAERPVGGGAAVVWADDATPFTGAQARELLAENARLRAALGHYRHCRHAYTYCSCTAEAEAALGVPPPGAGPR